MDKTRAINIMTEQIRALRRSIQLRQAELDQWTPLDEGEKSEIDALEMAIRVLEDEPSNPSEQLSIQYSKGYQDGFLAAKELFGQKGEGE